MKMIWCLLFHRGAWELTGIRRMQVSQSLQYKCSRCGLKQSRLVWDVGVR